MRYWTVRPFLLILAVAIAAPATFAAEPDPFAKWETAIAAFEKQDQAVPPPRQALLFVGSSSIRLWDTSADFPDRETINRGFGGSEIADSTYFADRIILKHEPRTVVLYAGDNDISHGNTAKEVTADFNKFVGVVHGKLPETRILFIAIKPSIKRWNLAETMLAANREIETICRKNEQLDYVDIWKPMLGDDGRPRPELFAKDGLHLNREGYKVWAEVLKPLLKEQ